MAHGLDDAFGDDVAAHDSAEDVDEYGARALVRKDELERGSHAVRGRGAADVEEIRRLAALELDEVHRRHRESRAVDHARDVAAERDVAELVFCGTPLHRVFLRGIAQRHELGLAEERIRLDVDLCVEGDERAVLRHDQRIDLDEREVALEIEPVQRARDALEFHDLLAGEAEAIGEAAALERLQAGGRMDVRAQDALRVLFRDFLDVHAAGRGGNECVLARFAVEQQAEVQLALDRAARFDVHDVDRQPCGVRLRRHEPRAQHGLRRLADFAGRTAELDAAPLAAAARMDLRLDDPDRARQFARRGDGLRLGRGDPAARHRHAVFGEDALRLVFVKIHHSIVPGGLNRVANAGRAAGRPRDAW